MPKARSHTKLRSKRVFLAQGKKLKNPEVRYQNKVRLNPDKARPQLGLKSERPDCRSNFLKSLPKDVQQALILGCKQVGKKATLIN